MTENVGQEPASSAGETGRASSSKAILTALLALLAALLPALALWGFTVDDALITARVASHLASGAGYRFNSSGPVTDAVTPLGYAHVLAAAGSAEPLAMLERARWLGLAAWLPAAAYLGYLLRGLRWSAVLAALLLLALSAPLACWVTSGLETGLVAALATLALGRGPVAPLAAGLAAAWRPELLPWAVVLSGGRALVSEGRSVRAVALALAQSVGPALAVALLRYHYFGDPAPLAVSAKPSDLSHGLRYAAACFVGGGAPLALVAPLALRRADRETRILALAALAHLVALMLAGGDWMALFRLLVPVLPTILYVVARLADRAPGYGAWLRLGSAALVSCVVLITSGLPARHVLEHRRALIERARPVLASARAVAAEDIGWVGAATSSPLIDLAGVTDPVIAILPGGHTTKRIPEELLRARGVDTWVLLLAPGATLEQSWQDSRFAYGVEQRLSRLDLAREFEVTLRIPLGGTTQSYVILKRSRGELDRAPAALP